MKTKKNRSASTGIGAPRKNIVVVLLILILMSAMTVGVYLGLKALYQTETYYVLNRDIPARTRITPDMLQERVVNKGGAPQNAISKQEIASGMVFAKTPLLTGDVLSDSNVGLSLDTNAGIPDDWVITSFNISSTRAVGGQVRRGDYFDIIGVSPAGAKYILMDVLALDVHHDTQNQYDEQGQVASINEEVQYIVGLPPESAAILAHITDGGAFESIRVVLSPRSLSYKERDVDALDEEFTASEKTRLISLYEGTDNSFTPVLRDNNGRPVNRLYCEAGKIDPPELCDRLEDLDVLDRDNVDDYIVDDDYSYEEPEEEEEEYERYGDEHSDEDNEE